MLVYLKLGGLVSRYGDLLTSGLSVAWFSMIDWFCSATEAEQEEPLANLKGRLQVLL